MLVKWIVQYKGCMHMGRDDVAWFAGVCTHWVWPFETGMYCLISRDFTTGVWPVSTAATQMYCLLSRPLIAAYRGMLSCRVWAWGGGGGGHHCGSPDDRQLPSHPPTHSDKILPNALMVRNWVRSKMKGRMLL